MFIPALLTTAHKPYDLKKTARILGIGKHVQRADKYTAGQRSQCSKSMKTTRILFKAFFRACSRENKNGMF